MIILWIGWHRCIQGSWIGSKNANILTGIRSDALEQPAIGRYFHLDRRICIIGAVHRQFYCHFLGNRQQWDLRGFIRVRAAFIQGEECGLEIGHIRGAGVG